MELKVTDNYRTNPLSLKPGGYEVTVIYSTGKALVYDKVKKPGSYIKGMAERNKSGIPITQILIDGKSAWHSDVNDTNPWEI